MLRVLRVRKVSKVSKVRQAHKVHKDHKVLQVQSVQSVRYRQATVLKIVNTTTGLDPNPDYISQVLLTIPNGAIPNSITVTSPSRSSSFRKAK